MALAPRGPRAAPPPCPRGRVEGKERAVQWGDLTAPARALPLLADKSLRFELGHVIIVASCMYCYDGTREQCWYTGQSIPVRQMMLVITISSSGHDSTVVHPWQGRSQTPASISASILLISLPL